MATNSITRTTQTPADFICDWAIEMIGAPGESAATLPSQETLKEIERALHAVQEYLIESVGDAMKQVVALQSERDETRKGGLTPEAERPVDFADVGRFIVWADELRHGLGFTLGAVQKIALIAHDDFPALAQGYSADSQCMWDDGWNKNLRRFHGLDEVG